MDLFEIKFTSKITNIKFKKILIKDSFTLTKIDNSFIAFTSINKSTYIIYSIKDNYSIICFDFNNEKIIYKKEFAHASDIMSFRHSYNTTYNKEYIVSVSSNRNIKLWEFPSFSCLTSIEKAHRASFIFSLCLLTIKETNYIFSSSGSDEERIRVWDFKGNKILEIKDSKERTGYIDVYHSQEKNISYVIIGNYGNIKSFDFNKNELYKIYCDNSEMKNDHPNFVIYEKENSEIILIDSCYDGFIRLWDFHSAILVKKIRCSKNNYSLKNICLSEDNKYLFTVCSNENDIKIIDLNQKAIITCIKVKANELLSIKTIRHNIYGSCILTKGVLNDNIKLWIT
jgi:WD40 repeat protein